MASRTAYSTWTPQKPTLFDGHYLSNRSTLDIGVLVYIGIVQHKEHSPEVLSVPPGTPCVYIYIYIYIYFIPCFYNYYTPHYDNTYALIYWSCYEFYYILNCRVCCAVQYCTVLYCTVPYRTVLYSVKHLLSWTVDSFYILKASPITIYVIISHKNKKWPTVCQGK